jgi:hypothetical protein
LDGARYFDLRSVIVYASHGTEVSGDASPYRAVGPTRNRPRLAAPPPLRRTPRSAHASRAYRWLKPPDSSGVMATETG